MTRRNAGPHRRSEVHDQGWHRVRREETARRCRGHGGRRKKERCPVKPAEYSSFDGVGLADLVARGEVSAAELADTARAAIDEVNPRLNAVIGWIDAVAE